MVCRLRAHKPDRSEVRPFDRLGAAADPMHFGEPRFDVACRREQVLVYIAQEEAFEPFYNVLMRVDDHVEYAYAPISTKPKSASRTGHVEYCNVLQRCRTEEKNDLVFELTPRVVAVKVCFQHKMDHFRATRQVEDTFKEVAVMQELGKIPHVSTCEEALYVKDEHDPGNSTYNIVMPYYEEGDIFDLLERSNRNGCKQIVENKAKCIFRDLMLGLRALHDRGVCHHDISIENVMLQDGRAYVIDMGMALKVPYCHDKQSRTYRRCLVKPQGAYGKLPYMAPEVYTSASPASAVHFDSEAIDVWSAGCVLFCMITGEDSYELPLTRDTKFLYMVYHLQDLLDEWGVQVSKECVHLIERIFQVNPRLRYTIDEVLNHPWLH